MRYLQLSTYVWVCWTVQRKFLVAVNWRQPFFTTLIHNCDADQPPKVGNFYWNNKTLLCQANPILIIVTTLVSCNPCVRLYQYMGALPRTARQSGALSEKYIGPCPSLSPSIYIVSQWQCKYHNIFGISLDDGSGNWNVQTFLNCVWFCEDKQALGHRRVDTDST